MNDLAGTGSDAERHMQQRLREHQAKRQDELVRCTDWKDWLDDQRHVACNAFGELSHPDSKPDWSLLYE